MTTTHDVPMPKPRFAFATAHRVYYTADQVRDTAIAYADARSAQESSALLGLIADIRKAAGDPTGKLDWPELVAHVAKLSEDVVTWRGIVEGEAELRALAIEEIEDIKAERDALAEKVKALEADARRYRWLRDESNYANRHAPIVVNCPLDDQLRSILCHRELDEAIDAAIGGDET